MFLKLHQINVPATVYVNMDLVQTITPDHNGGDTQLEGPDFVIWVTESAESIVDRCITLTYGVKK